MGATSANRPPASASGTLTKTPLAHLLLYALEKRLSGTIELAASDERAAGVLFVSGEPAKARMSQPVAHLGRVLLELGHLTEEQLTRSLADLAQAKREGAMLHGELLLNQGVIDRKVLDAGLREQLARNLRSVAALPPETRYAYYDGFNGLHDWGGDMPSGFDPLPILWGVLRENPPWAQVDAGLKRVAGSSLRLSSTADISRLGLGDAERVAAEMLGTRAMSAEDVAAASKLPEAEARLFAYLLLATKQVDVLRPTHAAGRSASPSSSSTQAASRSLSPSPARSATRSQSPSPSGSPSVRSMSPSPMAAPDAVAAAIRITRSKPPLTTTIRRTMPPPATGLSPELVKRWGEVIDRAATIDRTDYFTMLDLARDATKQEIESAFFALAKQWHPDSLPPELAPIRDACARVFGRISEAHSTLSDDEQRVQYMQLLAEGSGSPEMQQTVAQVVEAATDFQKAQVCFKRHDYAQAEGLCRKALEADPTQPDYHAMLAWLVALKPENQSPEKTKECIQLLDRALLMGDKCERAYFWRGMLYKRLGRGDIAVRDFRSAFDLNPRNIDAAREVRLHRMRGGTSSTSPPPAARANPASQRPSDGGKPGLFGKLFKKP